MAISTRPVQVCARDLTGSLSANPEERSLHAQDRAHRAGRGSELLILKRPHMKPHTKPLFRRPTASLRRIQLVIGFVPGNHLATVGHILPGIPTGCLETLGKAWLQQPCQKSHTHPPTHPRMHARTPVSQPNGMSGDVPNRGFDTGAWEGG